MKKISKLSSHYQDSSRRKIRDGWDEQIKKALKPGKDPENDLFENITDDWDKTEWTWPEELIRIRKMQSQQSVKDTKIHKD